MTQASPSPLNAEPIPPEAVKDAPLPWFVRGALCLGLVSAVAMVAMIAVRVTRQQRATNLQERINARQTALRPHKILSPKYRDENRDLVADAPSDPASWLNPDPLVVAYYTGDGGNEPRIDWPGFEAHLQARTGKRIRLTKYSNHVKTIAAIAAGELHIVALHSADVPHVVNDAGFVPVAVLGSESGADGNHMDIAVNPQSNVRQLSDLRGRNLVCTRADSVTGYRAAITVLWYEQGMRPNVDYQVFYSFGQKSSLKGLRNGTIEIAAISNDKLNEELKRRTLEELNLRVVYESQVIARRAIGYIHSLHPDLAGQVNDAILSFENTGGNDDNPSGRPLRFYPANYKEGFEFARQMHDCCEPRSGDYSE